MCQFGLPGPRRANRSIFHALMKAIIENPISSHCIFMMPTTSTGIAESVGNHNASCQPMRDVITCQSRLSVIARHASQQACAVSGSK